MSETLGTKEEVQKGSITKYYRAWVFVLGCLGSFFDSVPVNWDNYLKLPGVSFLIHKI